MSKMKIFFLCIVFFLSVSITNASAWDGQRKGFILGFGLGLGLISYTQDVESFRTSETSDRENELALNTDFKIGYAPNNQLAIYFSGKTSWFGMTNVYDEDVTITNDLSSVGATYFFNPAVPSLFLSGGLGVSYWDAPFEEETEAWTGFGFFIGGGYEFAKHWSTEVSLMWGNPSATESGLDVSANAVSVMLTVNILGY